MLGEVVINLYSEDHLELEIKSNLDIQTLITLCIESLEKVYDADLCTQES